MLKNYLVPLIYSSNALSLALIIFPLFVFVGEHYASQFGISLLGIGLIFLLVRLLDGLLDPLIGLASDNLNFSIGKRKFWLLVSLPFTLIGVWGLFGSNLDSSFAFQYFVFNIILLTIGLSLFTPPFYSLGAELSENYVERSRITFFREGFFLLGTILAALLYALAEGSTQALKNIAIVICICHPLMIVISIFFIREKEILQQRKSGIFSVVTTILVERKLRFFFLSQFFNAAANGIPGALFAFFVIHKLQREDLVGALMLIYLVSGVLAVPLWIKVGKYFKKSDLWCFSMFLSMSVFLLVFFLDAESVFLFSFICIFTGVCVSADSALPTSIQADLLDEDLKRTNSNRSGTFFSILSVINKSAAAFSGGFVLLFLYAMDFDPLGDNSEEVLFWLTCLYAIAPITLKIFPLLLMFGYPEKRTHKSTL